MSVPSIKGSAFLSLVEDIRRMVDEGTLDLDALELSDKDRGVLDQLITPISWMPIATYDRLLQVVCQVEGGSDIPAYLRNRGARAAERLLSGDYGTFRADQWTPKVAESFLGISRMLYSFTSWRVDHTSDDAITFTVTDARNLPDTALETAHGFLEYFASMASGKPARVVHERLDDDTVRMQVELA